MSGVFDPIVWTDGEEPENTPTADDLNDDWRDSFNFFLGTWKPMMVGYCTLGTAVGTSDTVIGWNNERLKRSLTHSTSSSSQNIVIQYDGQYQGYLYAAYDTISNQAARLISRVRVNGVSLMNIGMKPESTAWNLVGSFTIDCVAGDTVSMTMAVSTGTAIMGTLTTRLPKMAIWYAGDGS